MNVKSIVTLILMVMVWPCLASAQDQPANNMQLVVEKIRADKKLFIAENMQFAETEAEAFWPVYEKYQDELFLLRARLMKLIELTNNQKLLISATDAAKCLGISRTMFYEQMNSGRLPYPIRFGRRMVWSAEEMKQWIAAGCPNGDKWAVIKKTKR